MDIRGRVIVALGLVVLVAVAALGAQTLMGSDDYPQAWGDQAIGPMGLSHDRRTLWVQSEEQLHPSCYEARAEVQRGPEQWTVTLEARRTDPACLLGACIDSRPTTGRAVVLGPGEQLDCRVATVVFDEPVPDDVALVSG